MQGCAGLQGSRDMKQDYPFEIGLLLNWRRHLGLRKAGMDGIFRLQDMQRLSQCASLLERHDFVPEGIGKDVTRILQSSALIYPTKAFAPCYKEGKRESARLAYEIGSRLFLAYSVAESKKRATESTVAQLEDIIRLDGFITCALTARNVRRLRAGRWMVEAPSISLAPDLVPVPEGIDDRLYPFQVKGVQMLLSGYRLLADEMGLGKTAQALQFVHLSGRRKVLIVCPASLKMNWKRECQMWCEGSIDMLKGTAPRAYMGFRFTIVNYDILPYWENSLIKGKLDLIIADESHYLQNMDARRTRSFMKVAKGVDTIFISGTPYTSRPIQLFPILNKIAPETFPSMFQFGHSFCDPRLVMGKWSFQGATHMEMLNQLLVDGIMIRRTKSQVMTQLPKKRRILVYMTLNEDERTREIERKIALAKRDDARLEYERQYSSALKMDSCIEWIKNYLEQTDEKLVVFAVHKRAIDRIMRRFKGLAVKFDGDSSDSERDLAVARFQGDCSIRLFVGNIQAAGVGITLTKARATCTIELSWKSSDHLQSEDRINRIGQTASCISCYYLIAEDTIDEPMMRIINRKARIQERILDGRSKGVMLNMNANEADDDMRSSL